MQKIQLLDETTINQIAAGEVIENPASVVKELVENALDAGATEISVEIKGGGRELIRVRDNGSGMSPEDAKACLQRHATSKITHVEDILAVHTMGFRGEAIPSIASISKFNLLTSDGTQGTMVIVDGGRFISQAAAARVQGTTIEVKQLFFNVPARKKFLRSPTYDSNEMIKVITTLGLANPQVKFELFDNQTSVLRAAVPEGGDFSAMLSDRIYDLLGEEFLNALLPVALKCDGFSLQGFVGNPASSRAGRGGQHLFINQRAVIAPAVSYAVADGYGHALASGRHPIFVLHLTVPGDMVDVNVHPQKKEVRLRYEAKLKEKIKEAVQEALTKSCEWVSEEEPPLSLPTFTMPPWSDEEYTPAERDISFESTAPPPLQERMSITKETLKETPAPSFIEEPLMPQVLATIPGFILLEPLKKGEGSLWLLNQKNSHCRVIYEKLQAVKEVTPIPQQTLLIPYTLELSSHEAAALKEHLETLNRLGIQIREFGKETFVIDALPEVFGSIDLQQFLQDIVQGLLSDEGEKSYKQAAEKQVALTASRIALTSKEKIGVAEAKALVKQLFSCQEPYCCPLGRPTLAKLSQEQLTKYF